MNVCLESGLTSCGYLEMIETIVGKVMLVYDAECIVVQCGCDGLSNDPVFFYSSEV